MEIPQEVELRGDGLARLLARSKNLDDAAWLAMVQQCRDLWKLAVDLAHEPCATGAATTCRRRGVDPMCLSCRARTLVGWP